VLVNLLKFDGISGCVLCRDEALPGTRLVAWKEIATGTSKRAAVVIASGRFPAVSITFCVLLERPYCAAAFSNYVNNQEIALATARICSAKCDPEASDQRSGVASGNPQQETP
jgi:hypothetical protein